MTLAQDCAWGLLRSGGVAAAAVAAARGVRALVWPASRRVGRVVWLLHLVPYLTPVLLVGYAYSSFSLSLVRHPAWNQALYTALVWLKLVPLATLAVTFAPSPLSPEAVHCHRLVRRGRRWRPGSALAFWLHGAGRAAGVAFAAVFLFAFGEFEMASLFGIRTWTVALFDAQVGGLALGDSLWLGLPAFLCETVALLLALALVFPRRPGVRQAARRGVRAGPVLRAVVWGYLGAAMVLVTVVPLLIVLGGTVRSVGLMAQVLPLTREVGVSALFGLVAATCAYLVAGCFLRREAGRGRLLAASAACVPGLLGPLVLSLVVLAAFQLPALRGACETPAPLLVALTLLLLPFALLLRVLLAAAGRAESVHAAALLRPSSSPAVARRGRAVEWELRSKGQFWVAFLLFCWGYLDLTASSILAPPRLTPVVVRLYNFMHYGQSALLSAMVCVTFAVPLIVLLLALPAHRGLAGLLAFDGSRSGGRAKR